MGETLKLNLIKFYILKREFGTALNHCIDLLRNNSISAKTRAKIYRLLAAFLDGVSLSQFKELYELSQVDRFKNIDLEENENFLIFLFSLNFQLYLNHQYVQINKDKDSYREEAIRCYKKLSNYAASAKM